MKNSKLKTSYDSYANLVKIEKNECAIELSNTQEKIDELNTQFKDIKEKTVELEFRVRGYADTSGTDINLSEYNMICLNLNDLSIKEIQLRDVEKTLKSVHDMQFKELTNKQKLHDKLLEKQKSSRVKIEFDLDSKSVMDMDDLWGQANWVKKDV